jgi:hypothetical protein
MKLNKWQNKLLIIDKFLKTGDSFINSYGDDGRKKLRSLIGKELVKKSGDYWYWGFSKLSIMTIEEIEDIIMKIERNTPPFVSDDFQIGYNGAFENKT